MTVRLPEHRAPTHPGEMLLEEFIKPMELKQQEVADRLGVSYPRLNDLIHGRRGVTIDTALRLERLFGASAEFWLNLQRDWDLYEALHSGATKRTLSTIRPMRAKVPGSAKTRA